MASRCQTRHCLSSCVHAAPQWWWRAKAVREVATHRWSSRAARCNSTSSGAHDGQTRGSVAPRSPGMKATSTTPSPCKRSASSTSPEEPGKPHLTLREHFCVPGCSSGTQSGPTFCDHVANHRPLAQPPPQRQGPHPLQNGARADPTEPGRTHKLRQACGIRAHIAHADKWTRRRAVQRDYLCTQLRDNVLGVGR
eukprot:SAG11_NODE_8716_length_984_cov_1.101695_1_plen_194_part_01